MAGGFQVDGLAEVVADWAAHANQFPAEARKVTRSHADQSAAKMRSNIAKRTGAAAGSITVDARGSNRAQAVAEAGPTVPYARFLEYGTSKMAPRPFLDRSVDEPSYVRDMTDLLKDLG